MNRCRRYALVALAALLTAQTAPAPAESKADADAALQAELRAVYANWTRAMAERDPKLWRSSIARHRMVGIRNMVVSEKKPWPDALFEAPVAPPDISGMKLARLMVVGVTAQLVYYGKADFGVEDGVEIPDGLLALMFVREKSGWKFNTSRFMSLAGAGEIADQASAGDFSFLDVPEFQPPGRAPPVPKLCPLPEQVGYVEIVSSGYDTRVDIGAGRSMHRVIDNSQRGLIIGGLKTGINPILVEARPLPMPKNLPAGAKPPVRNLEISVFRVTKNPSKPLKRIYHSGKNTKPGKFRVMVRGDS